MADVSKIKLPDNTVLDIKDGRMGNAKIFYGTCTTAGDTAAKVVTCPDFTSGDLVTGALIFVTFSEANSASASSLTLNVNSTGAYSIKKQYRGSIDTLTVNGEIRANVTYLFTFMVSTWACMTMDYNTVYGAMSLSDAQEGTDTSSCTMKATTLKSAIQYWIGQDSTLLRKSGGTMDDDSSIVFNDSSGNYNVTIKANSTGPSVVVSDYDGDVYLALDPINCQGFAVSNTSGFGGQGYIGFGYTCYSIGEIINRQTDSPYGFLTYALPSSTGTLAITSQIPSIATSLSSQSTDTETVSAKCVYDIVGNIETLINAL